MPLPKEITLRLCTWKEIVFTYHEPPELIAKWVPRYSEESFWVHVKFASCFHLTIIIDYFSWELTERIFEKLKISNFFFIRYVDRFKCHSIVIFFLNFFHSFFSSLYVRFTLFSSSLSLYVFISSSLVFVFLYKTLLLILFFNVPFYALYL